MEHQERAIVNEVASLGRYTFAKQFIKPAYRILDIGCGLGFGTRSLFESASAVIGIDYSKDAIEFAKRHYEEPQCKFMVSNAEKIELTTKFDMIVAFEIIEHVKSPKVFVKECKRLIKENGIMVLSTPNEKWSTHTNPFHINEMTFPQLSEILEGGVKDITDIRKVSGQCG